MMVPVYRLPIVSPEGPPWRFAEWSRRPAAGYSRVGSGWVGWGVGGGACQGQEDDDDDDLSFLRATATYMYM